MSTILITESKNTLTEDQRLAEMYRCDNDFRYFLVNYVRTRNTQERKGIQAFPNWPYLMQAADDIQSHRQIAILKSRQLLLTWLLAARLVHLCTFRRGEELVCVSRGGMYSREVGLRAESIYDNLPKWMQSPVKTNRQFGEYLFLDTESKFMCVAADEDAGRSFSPSGIFFDEVAFFPHASKIMAALAPLLEEAVDFVAVSTPNGEDPLFYDMWHAKHDDVHRISLHYTQRPGRDTQEWKEKAQRRPGMTLQKWMREYEHSFATPAGRPVYETWNALQAQRCFDKYDKNKPLLRGFDRGFDDPAILFAQETDDNQLQVLHSEKGSCVPRETWLKHCKNLTESLFPCHRAGYLDYGAADFSKPESDGDSWRKVMKKYGIYLKDAQKDDIDRRLNATRLKMQLRQDNKFGLIVDPDHCKHLIDGLSGGYCYPDKPDYQGRLKPLKNQYSHEADCVGHICDNHFNVHGEARGKYNYEQYIPKHDQFGRPA